MNLETGKIYEVMESCGMFVLKGKYIGYIEYNSCPMDNVLIFLNKTVRSKGGHKYFGAQWVVSGSTNNPHFYLRSSHSGNNISTLEPLYKRHGTVIIN